MPAEIANSGAGVPTKIDIGIHGPNGGSLRDQTRESGVPMLPNTQDGAPRNRAPQYALVNGELQLNTQPHATPSVLPDTIAASATHDQPAVSEKATEVAPAPVPSKNTTVRARMKSQEPTKSGYVLTAHEFEPTTGTEGAATKIALDDLELDIADERAAAIGQAVQQGHDMMAAEKGLDCYAFGMLVAGGTVNAIDKDEYVEENFQQSYLMSRVDPIEGLDEADLPEMQPLGIGNPGEDNGSFSADHIIVKIGKGADGTDRYISKLGDEGIVVTDLQSIADMYESTYVGPYTAARLERKDTGEIIFDYPPAVDVKQLPVENQEEIQRVLDRTQQMTADGNAVDCHLFGIMLGGGHVAEISQEDFDTLRLDSFEAGDFADISGIDHSTLPSMQPLLLRDANGVVQHTVVRVPGSTKYLGKWGQADKVELTDLDSVARMYGATEIAPLVSASSTDKTTGELLLNYKAPGIT